VKDDPDYTTCDNDSLLTLIDPIELMSEEGVEIVDYPEFIYAQNPNDSRNELDLLEFDF
jgi:hypothetical protein